MMPVFKNAVPGPHCASYCTNGTKDSPNRQTICQARSYSYAIPTRTDCCYLPGGMPGSPPALPLLCPRRGVRAHWKEEKWGGFAGVYRELLQGDKKQGRKSEPSRT